MEFTCNTPVQQAFMELVRCGVAGSVPDERFFRGLSASDWEEIYTLARRQTVCGICYDAYCKLPDRLLPAGSLLPRWVARVNAIEATNRAMNAAVVSLVKSLRGLGLNPLIQKGLSVARFYPNPELRECGDIDLWLPANEMERAIAFATSIDSGIKTHADASLSFIFDGFVVELHRRLISLSAPGASRRLEAYISRYYSRGADCESEIPSPSPLLELLLVSVHIMRHAFGTGIGLRQLCDYMLAAQALKEKYDGAEFARAGAELGISRWISVLNEVLITYLGANPAIFGAPAFGKPSGIRAASLMAVVMEGGNFGLHRSEGAGSESGKLHTLSMLLRRSRFAFRIAPAEAFWNIVRLSAGQLH